MSKKSIKAFMYYCNEETCGHDWVSKKEEYICPECGSTFLIVEKLK